MRTLALLALLGPLCLVGCIPTSDTKDTSDADADADADADTDADADADTDADVDFGTIVGHAPVEYAEDLVVVGDYAYVTSKGNGLRVIDVSDPSTPTEVDVVESLDQAWDVAATSNLLFLADYAGGLRIFDIGTDPASPDELGSYVPGWTVISAAINGNRVYVGGGDAGGGNLAVLDVSDPSVPQEMGSSLGMVDESATSLACKGDIVYLGGIDGTLFVLDTSNPAAISESNSYYNPGTAGHEPWGLGLFVDENTLYYSDWGAGVILLDISTPANPTELSVFAEGGYAFYDAWATGDRAYIALDGGLGVLDVSDPANPTLVGGDYISATTNMDDGLHGVDVKNNLAFLADNKDASLTIIDVGE